MIGAIDHVPLNIGGEYLVDVLFLIPGVKMAEDLPLTPYPGERLGGADPHQVAINDSLQGPGEDGSFPEALLSAAFINPALLSQGYAAVGSFQGNP